MDRPIDMPLKGLSDELNFGKQPAFTTREALNVRSIDPSTGRVRLSQRSGMSKFNQNEIISGGKIQELHSINYDSRNISYDAKGIAEIEGDGPKWTVVTQAQADTVVAVTDTESNVYIIDGTNSIAKYSVDGKRVWNIPLPVADTNFVVRALFVDDVFDVYAGVSSGGDSRKAQLWKYQQEPDNKTALAWTIEVGGYTEKIQVTRDKLYALQNFPDLGRARVGVYEALDATAPQLTQFLYAPHPANDFVVRKDGAIFVASPEGGRLPTDSTVAADPELVRGPNPVSPDSRPDTVHWSPKQLTDWQRRIWSWHIAADITEPDVSGELKEGAPILRWPDSSGHDRDYFAAIELGYDPPVLTLRGAAGKPAVRFEWDGDTTSPRGMCMESGRNPGTSRSQADHQRTPIPSYDGAAYALFMAVVPKPTRTTAAGSSGSPIISQHQDVSGFFEGVLNNRTSNALVNAGGSNGFLSFFSNPDAVDFGSGAGGQPLSYLHTGDTEDNGVVLIGILHDGGLNTGIPGPTATRSMFWVNGKPVDRWESDPRVSSSSVRLGGDNTGTPSGGTIAPLECDILEIICLDLDHRPTPGSLTATETTILTHDAYGSSPGTKDSAIAPQNKTEWTMIHGYLAHKYGCAGKLPRQNLEDYESPYGISPTSTPVSLNSTLAGPPTDGDLVQDAHRNFLTGAACLCKFSSAGDLQWVANYYTIYSKTSDTDDTGGVGWACALNSAGNIYSVGDFPEDHAGVSAGTIQVRLIIDQGADFSVSVSDGAWQIAGETSAPGPLTYQYPRLAVDTFDNLFVPWRTAGSPAEPFRMFKSDGTAVIIGVDTPNEQRGNAVALNPRIPEYETDLDVEGKRAEVVYVATTNDSTLATPTLLAYDIVQVATRTGSPRVQKLYAFGEGLVRSFEAGSAAPVTIDSTQLSSTSQYLQATTLFGEIFVTDGEQQILVVNPRTDLVTKLEATSAGKAPERVKILESWRGRLVAARGVGLIDEAHNWKMSKKGNPRDWDAFPPVRDVSAAIGGDNAVGPGMCPDIVNGFVPYNNDYAFFLCDHSIYQLTGDPSAGGEFDLVSDITGGAFGRAWCKDPEGNLWFVGSRGGLYVMRPGSLPERVSLHNIERRLQDIDFSTRYVRLFWNHRDEGLHVLQFPFGSAIGSVIDHWFWDTKNGAAWQDSFGIPANTTVQPTAAMVIDGDEVDDRLFLFGCEDGKVRQWDESARDDDGVQIDGQVVVGPLVPDDASLEYRFVGPNVVLAQDQSGARYELFATDEPDRLGQPQRTGSLTAGRNPQRRDRVRGSYCFLRIGNASRGQRFAIEHVSMDVYPAGKRRKRGTQ